MPDYHRDCCPLLRIAAEAQQLVDVGLVLGEHGMIQSIVIGRLRERYGCPGPGAAKRDILSRNGWSCPWDQWGSVHLDDSTRVPWLSRAGDDGRKTPGAML